MHKTTFLVLIMLVFLSVQSQAADQPPLKTAKDKVSYGIGVDLVRNFKKQGIEADLELVIKGIRDGSSGVELLMTDAEISKTLAEYQKQLATNQAQIRLLTAERNKREGAAYLKANKNREGVVVLVSGLQYRIIKAGGGKVPTDNDNVTCRYRGTLIDGTEFDSSDRLGFPLTFNVKDSVVKGWAEALKLMPAGSKWQIVVPPELAYGEKGAGRDIGPNAVLLYEIDLIAVNGASTSLNIKDLKP